MVELMQTTRADIENEINEQLGKRLFLRRRAMGLTQQSLARAIGITFQQIQKYECGASRMSPARLWALSKALEVDVDYFFNGLASRTAPLASGKQPQGEAANDEREPARHSPLTLTAVVG
jgi:transcriptional regulator with XRE-family HTH domain